MPDAAGQCDRASTTPVSTPTLHITDAELYGNLTDLRIQGGRIVELGCGLAPMSGETLLAAHGGALLPGLHDHHIHLFALAARAASVPCGPPRVCNAAELAAALAIARSAVPLPGSSEVASATTVDAAGSGAAWLRGIGYHESVAGDLSRVHLDQIVCDHPLRIQHRSGKLWMLNSAAIERIKLQRFATLEGVETDAAGVVTGRLFRLDAWLRDRLHEVAGTDPFPNLAPISTALLAQGVTGVTDTTAHNGAVHLQAFEAAMARGELPQRLCMMGTLDLPISAHPRIQRGALKLLLDDAALPEFDSFCAHIARAHAQQRAVAVHCVTRTELVFALAAFAASGSHTGDRIEHAGIAPDDTLPLLRSARLCVVTQPNFIAERGDQYLLDNPTDDIPLLYRAASLLRQGIPVGGSTDAPFGEADPWAAMHAAVHRQTVNGLHVGLQEALLPEQALALFTSPAHAPGAAPRHIHVGAAADLCLLDRPWAAARARLHADDVRATVIDGELRFLRAD